MRESIGGSRVRFFEGLSNRGLFFQFVVLGDAVSLRY